MEHLCHLIKQTNTSQGDKQTDMPMDGQTDDHLCDTINHGKCSDLWGSLTKTLLSHMLVTAHSEINNAKV